MPRYVVAVEEIYDQVVEAIHHEYRTVVDRLEFTVEADDEEHAESLVLDEDLGRCTDRWRDYGDVYDSEWVEEGNVLSEDYVERNIIEVHPPRELPRTTRIKPATVEPEWEI